MVKILRRFLTMKRVLGIGTVAALVSWLLFQVPFLRATWQSIDLFCLDSWIRMRATIKPAPNEVLIVAIDDQSLQEIGPWPWPRSIQAQLINKIAQADIRALGIDLIYDKPRADDKILAASLEKMRTILPVYTDENTGIYIKNHGLFIERLLEPTPLLRNSAFNLGHIILNYDPDGLTRRVPVFVANAQKIFPAFGITLALAAQDQRPQKIIFAPHKIIFNSLSIPIDEKGNFFIGYQGGPGSIPSVSAADVLRDRLPLNIFKGKIILLGVTANKVAKKWATPFVGEGPTSGVEIQAQIVNSILQDRIPALTPSWLNLLLTITLSLIATVIAQISPIILVCWLLLPAYLFIWGLGALNYLLLNLILPPIPLALALSFAFLNVFAYKAWLYRKNLLEQTMQLGTLTSISPNLSLEDVCNIIKRLSQADEIHALFLLGDRNIYLSIPKEECLASIKIKANKILDRDLLKKQIEDILKEQKKDHYLLITTNEKNICAYYIILRKKKFNPEEKSKIYQFISHARLILEREALRQEIKNTKRGIINMWLKKLSQQSPTLYEHSLFVARLAIKIAQNIDLDPEQQKIIYETGLLHDIGLFGLPERLIWEEITSPQDRMWIETHPQLGADLLKEVSKFDVIAKIIHNHHERFDGRGFPEGLKGNEIPLEARIIGLAEGIATSIEQKKRAGKTWKTIKKEIYEEIRKDEGKRFDPRLVQIFLNLKGDWQDEKIN